MQVITFKKIGENRHGPIVKLLLNGEDSGHVIKKWHSVFVCDSFSPGTAYETRQGLANDIVDAMELGLS